jgi:hypothetical protein
MMPDLSMVSMSQRNLVLLLVGVCVLSAAIGSGLALLAQTGPSGPAGPRGPAGRQGPEGQEGPSGAAEVAGLEEEIEDLRGRVEASEDVENRLETLEAELSEFSGPNSALCEELELPC